MRKQPMVFCCLLVVALSAGAVVYGLRGGQASIGQYNRVDRYPRIRPDYCRTVIPPNIAPLNFLVQEDGSHYCVRIYSKQGEPIEVFSRSPKIAIPQEEWHELLNMNRGQQLTFDVYTKNKANQWLRFKTITNRIAHEDIDAFLVYRRIYPVHYTWRQMGVYQRNLYNFDESLVLDNEYYKGGCLNCHTFCNNSTDKMLIGIRSAKYGSSALLIEDGVVNKIGTKFGYTSWHPSGRLAAYSINHVSMFFHTAGSEVRDVVDLDSLLAYYLIDAGTVKTARPISRKDRLETYPAWSADGRYLYFCSAPKRWTETDAIPDRYDEIKYDLVRISYDLERDQWGELETVLSAEDTGLSILLPRVSPDGCWLLFCMCDYGSFPVYQSSSDLYMFDLNAPRENGRYKYQRLNINSDQSESWHSWSSNSRWITFSSKRQSGVFTRSYISYVDQKGKVYKPLLLPQKDPTYYDSCLWTYSVPELVTGPVRVTGERLGRVVRGSRKISVTMPITMATPKAGGLPRHDEPWKHERE